MAEFTQFIPHVHIHIGSECPRMAVIAMLKDVIRDFLSRSQAWVYDVPLIDITDPEQAMYVLDVPTDSRVCKMWSIKGRRCIGDYYQQPTHRIDLNNQLFFEDKLPANLTKLNPVVSLTTKQNALTCPDFVYENYHAVIVSGTVAKLQAMPAKTWSEPNMYQLHAQDFEAGIVKAERDVKDGFGLSRRQILIPSQYL